MAKHREVEMLLQIGEYQPGTNPLADEAIAKADAIKAFLSQRTADYAAPNDTEALLYDLSGPG
jgi:type III secretion protein N (ATPase)